MTDLLTASGIKPIRTSLACPWQNGIAERWIESRKRELLDHVIALNDRRLRRPMRDYLSYYHSARIHDSLEKDTRARVLFPPSRIEAIVPSSASRFSGFVAIPYLFLNHYWRGLCGTTADATLRTRRWCIYGDGQGVRISLAVS
jgi:hypothetical protein